MLLKYSQEVTKRRRVSWLTKSALVYESKRGGGGGVAGSQPMSTVTLQRQNAENLKQIFPEKEYRDLSPNFHIHVSVSELYIPTMGLPVLLEEICRLILGIYKSLKET
jgi:hypothetical protein